ncbi:nucleolar protein 14 [Lipomyces chichibuensis]|uniref:nucleolar protein 14 n=1 Tax=Lipomyces chichibuensis TaxID=1546026 RepID=UPI003344327F
MGKSQLKQLKERLKSNGFTGQTNVKKKQQKRHPASTRADKDQLLQSIREEFNPFDIKTTRQKHGDILGRKVQGAVGKPGLSKQIGEENRRRTLKKELERKNKVGAVIDRRFGETDSTMTPEEKMLERFTRERQARSSRSSTLFNLEDDDLYDAGTLTHFGQSLSLDHDDFDSGNPVSANDDNSDLKRRSPVPNYTSDESDIEEPERKKSKNEVMKEIIAKSKMYKHERQKAKEEDLEAIESLDSELNDLQSLLFQTSASAQPGSVPEDAERDTEYDANVREMVFDRRAKPSDRTKTEEETAEENARRLKELEEQRLRRMEGELSEEEDDGRKTRLVPEADDLGDDFVYDDAAEFGFGKGLDESDSGDEMPGEKLEGSEMEGSEEEEVDITNEDIPSDDEQPIPNAQSAVMSVTKSKTKLSESRPQVDAGLAFTYNCPSSYKELQSIFGEHNIENQVVIVERILTLHHPSLNKDNKEKLMKFAPILLEHVVNLSDEPLQLNNESFNKLIQKIYDLAKAYPEPMAMAFREQLAKVRDRLQAAIVRDRDQPTDYPLPSDMLLFALIGVVFSTSDHFHLVVTPAMLLMGQHLTQFPVKTLGELAAGSLLARLFSKYQTLSRRYVPEAVNHINWSIWSCIKQSAIPEGFPLPSTVTKLAIEGDHHSISLRNLQLSDIMCDTPLTSLSTPAEIQLALSIVKSDFDSLKLFSSLWKGKDAYKEIFMPSLELLEILEMELRKSPTRAAALGPIAHAVNENANSLKNLIKMQTVNRKPLALQQHKPIPIPTYAPKFEVNYSVDKKSYDPNMRRQEISKLKAQVKKERKGALRELRKDNAFVAREKLAEKKKKDKEYHEMLARLERTVASQG